MPNDSFGNHLGCGIIPDENYYQMPNNNNTCGWNSCGPPNNQNNCMKRKNDSCWYSYTNVNCWNPINCNNNNVNNMFCANANQCEWCKCNSLQVVFKIFSKCLGKMLLKMRFVFYTLPIYDIHFIEICVSILVFYLCFIILQ